MQKIAVARGREKSGVFKINLDRLVKRADWHPILRRWEQQRDLRALLELLSLGYVPPDFVPHFTATLKTYLEDQPKPDRKTGRLKEGETPRARRARRERADLGRLLANSDVGRTGNPRAKSRQDEVTDRAYAAILAAQGLGWEDREGFARAREALTRLWPEWSTKWGGDGKIHHRSLEEQAAYLRGLHYRRRRLPVDRMVQRLSLMIRSAGEIPPGPAYVSTVEWDADRNMFIALSKKDLALKKRRARNSLKRSMRAAV